MAMDPKKLAAFAKGGNPKDDEDTETSPDDEAAEGESEEGEGEEEDEESDYAIVDEVLAEMSDGKTDDELMGLIAGYDPETDGNPPAWVTDEALWERAKEAVDPEGEGAEYDDPWAVVAHVYARLGGETK